MVSGSSVHQRGAWFLITDHTSLTSHLNERASACSHHDAAHGSTLVLSVGGDDDVDVLHDALEGLVQLQVPAAAPAGPGPSYSS